MSDALTAPETSTGSSVPTSTGPSALSVGVVVWLASELMFFAGLFAGWFSLRSANEVWPPDDVHLAVGRTAAATRSRRTRAIGGSAPEFDDSIRRLNPTGRSEERRESSEG